jgi:sortase (surface protein transpeptidase)
MNRKFISFLLGFSVISGVLGWAVFRYSYAHLRPQAILSPVSLPSPTLAPTPTIAPPRQLIVPKLNLTTDIEYVGLDDNQRMDVPQDWNQVAWYQLGPKPGEQGSAVIAGHLDSPTGPSVFYHLNQLEPGDLIHTIDTLGQEHQFIVFDKATYSDANFPISLVFSQADARRLNLITCSGQFDKQTQNYSNRLVVFTRLKS